MHEQVIAVTVTYNDFAYLKRALDALRAQTAPVLRIVVVDNNSSDENKQKLKNEIGNQVDVVWLEENLGGAGGFEQGMRYANAKYDPDWYWLLDADAYPQSDCLEKMLEHRQESDRIGILAPLIYGVDLHQFQLYHIKYVSKLLYRDIMIYSSPEEIPSGASKIEACAFVGPLVARRAVEALGYPDSGLFIYGDDEEYTYRISRVFDVFLIKEAIINHRDQPMNGEQKPENWWKEYYAFRNTILFIKKYSKNRMYELAGIMLLYLRLCKKLLKNAVSVYSREMKVLRRELLHQAIADGMAGEKGKTVDPQVIRTRITQINSNTPNI